MSIGKASSINKQGIPRFFVKSGILEQGDSTRHHQGEMFGVTTEWEILEDNGDISWTITLVSDEFKILYVDDHNGTVHSVLIWDGGEFEITIRGSYQPRILQNRSQDPMPKNWMFI